MQERPKIVIDDKPYSRLPFDQRLPVIVFEPNHLYYLTTSPEMRRSLLDDLIEKCEPNFNKLKSNYTRTLKQRNTLLKQPLQTVKKQIFAWDVRLSELAGQYFQHRIAYLDKINQSSSEIYANIAGGSHSLFFNYDTSVTSSGYGSSLFTALQNTLEHDHLRGFTTHGIHRDDIAIIIDGKDMRDVASRGETRSILLTIKITEAQLLESVLTKPPIMLLDDVFGELDGARRKQLIEFIKTNQTFITTTDADVIGHDFVTKSNVIFMAR
jgi:DNA replication and repair protein RecF